ncbi:MAG: hypothetical protein OEY59_07485, partial [Deltaproteobacteria bacterium]|nr:hypothetical protein [Deltaproteobacteria bacterium]
GKIPPKECSTCHITNPNGKLKLDFGSNIGNQAGGHTAGTNDLESMVLKPGNRRSFGHGNDWAKNHKTQAAQEPAVCENCHEQSWCRDCHDGAVRPQTIHPNDWVTLHPRRAKTSDLNCVSCHNPKTFCADCHQNQRVTPETKPLDLNFHGEGWVSGPGPKHHSRIARRNISFCAACHDTESPTCLTCHSAKSGLKRSPHPRGFDGSKLPKSMCEKCHDPGDGTAWE